MAEWRLFRGWSNAELRARLLRLPETPLNFEGVEADMTPDNGWHHYYSEAVIARAPDLDARFERARVALANYTFSDPAIVTAHFDPAVRCRGAAGARSRRYRARPRRGARGPRPLDRDPAQPLAGPSTKLSSC